MPQPKKANPLFEILNGFCIKKPWSELSDDAREKYSQFMINRFICSYEYLIEVAEQLSTQRMDNESHYNILMDYVQHTKHYFKYLYWKSSPDTDKPLLMSIMKEYDVSMREARNYNELLNEEQRNLILAKWSNYFDNTKNT